MAEEPMSLDQALTASYADALTLGVSGIDADALARRAEAARAVLAEQSRRVDAAYRGAAGGAEPDVPAPFGTTLVLQHGGDLNAVLRDPMFALTLQQQMGLGYGTEYVHEDDDPRWESVAPTAEDDGRSITEAARVRAALVDLGAVDPTTGDAVVPGPVRAERQQVDPAAIAAQIQSGARADLWDESEWPDRESGEELAPFVSVALRRPAQETIESPRFVDVLSYEIAEARTVGEELPSVTAADRAEALRLAPQVWDALVDRGEQLAPQPKWWRSEREQLRVESPTLQARMEQAYLNGYDTRIQSGLAYDDAADDQARADIGGYALSEKVAGYEALEQARQTLDREVPPMPFYSEEVADAPLSADAAEALVTAAGEAGRWGGLDAGVDDMLTRIGARMAEHPGAPSVYAGDPRDALFNYLDPDAQRAQRALPQIERDNTVRAARALTEAPQRQGRGALFERLRERRDERRAQTASLTDPGRQTTALHQALTIK